MLVVQAQRLQDYALYRASRGGSRRWRLGSSELEAGAEKASSYGVYAPRATCVLVLVLSRAVLGVVVEEDSSTPPSGKESSRWDD